MKMKKQKRGGPSQAETSRKALANVDLVSVDAVAILTQIAADVSAPASARVAAAKALVAHGEGEATPSLGAKRDEELSRRALLLLRRRPR